MYKKQIIQLVLLIFSFYLTIFFIITGGSEYYLAYWFITFSILLGLYIIYSQKDFIFIKYLRILLYVILGYFIYSIIDNVVSLYTFYSDIYFNESSLAIFWELLQDGFNLFFALMISAVLLLNKPPRMKTLKIGKLKISL
jgi:hypothetical protein